MTKEEFKRRWELNEDGDGLTYDDIADCAKKWGLYSCPRIADINKVKKSVLKFAGIK